MDNWRADIAEEWAVLENPNSSWTEKMKANMSILKSRKKYKAKRQLQLYEKTTQSYDKFEDTRQISDIIMKGINQSLSSEDKNTFNAVVLDAYARLDFYRKSGHNYLKSEDRNSIESDFHALESALTLVASRSGAKLTDIPALISARGDDGKVVNYTEIRKEFESDYAAAKSRFKQQRAWLATKW